MTVERVDIYLLSLKAVLTARAAGVDPAVRCFWVLARCFWVLVRCFWVLRLSRTTDPQSSKSLRFTILFKRCTLWMIHPPFPLTFQLVVLAFSSRARIWGECSTIHPPPALFFFFFFNIPRISTVHSGSASRVIPLRLRWVKGTCVFRCNLPPALLAD